MSTTTLVSSSVLKDNFDNNINFEIWDLKRINNNRWSIVDWEGKGALKITVNTGDMEQVGNDGKKTERSEFSEKQSIWIPDNTDIWYGFSFYFPEDFYICNNRLVFDQWKQTTEKPESPFLSLRYINGKLICKVAYNEKKDTYESEGEWRGKWHEALINYKLNNANQGFFKIRIDHKLFVEYRGNIGSLNFKPNTQHFKFGLYRDQLDIPQTIYLAGFRRGLEKEDLLL